MRLSHDLRHIGDRADRIGGERHRHEIHVPGRELSRHRVIVEPARFGVHGQEDRLDPVIGKVLHPGIDVAEVLQLGDQDR